MARPAKIWKRSRDGFYYATVNGKKHKLAKVHKEALRIFHKMQVDKKPKTTASLAATLEEACNAFLAHGKETKAAKTIELQTAYLQSFCDFASKSRRVHDLAPALLDKWAMSKGWAESTMASAKRTVMACMNFCHKRKLILESPFWGIDRGTFERKERILTPEEKTKIKGAVKGGLADFLTFLELTGCRPFSEAGKVTAAMIDWDEKTIPFQKHKTAKKGKRRAIQLTPPLLDLLRNLADKRPEGTLFRTQQGRQWTRQAAAKAMRRIEARTKIPRLTVYAWRHTYITDCLAKGISPTIVAELVGNSVRTIHRYYSHIDQRKDALREAAMKAIT